MGAFSVMLYPGSQMLQRQYYKQQMRYAAYLLAADIRQIQQRTIFQPENYLYTLKVSGNDKHGYRIYREKKVWKRVRLEPTISLTCDSQMKSLSYDENGSPSVSGGYSLEHQQLPGVLFWLTVQPVTGRVTVYEK
ncbi:hypothetical protein [uncultured Phascolarctobacterium sp.]|uniref:hypothetical protein n=1 Tax=uncultured Phascolarctobacterium sp. TaxID=512296 RepID=UPI0027DB16AE|nr:hypothetical protein [uncultured Phascolarctobacterium sp.]